MRYGRLVGLALAVVLLCAGCGIPAVIQPGRSVVPSSDVFNTLQLTPFPEGAVFDYQIGGTYPPAANVGIVDRDRSQKAAAGPFNICYVNAYQAQPDAVSWWQKKHPDLLLRDASGALVKDRVWNEPLLDIGTDTKRTKLAAIVGEWFAMCGRSGYAAVEPDNLDSYTRSLGLLTQNDAVAFASVLARAAHTSKLLIGQKNAADLTPVMRNAGYDFAVAEECQQYDECSAYAAYGKKVIEIEYDARQFAAACQARAGKVSLLLRDREVVLKGKPGYVNKTC